jgi:negative regulator of flagellin synthesis FlgM
MKVGNEAEKVVRATTTPVKAGPAEAAKTGATPTTAIGATPEPSTKVELSSAASSLNSTQGSSAEFDAEKVARISQQIADGTFKVNHAAIADKLISNAQEALTKVTTH